MSMLLTLLPIWLPLAQRQPATLRVERPNGSTLVELPVGSDPGRLVLSWHDRPYLLEYGQSESEVWVEVREYEYEDGLASFSILAVRSAERVEIDRALWSQKFGYRRGLTVTVE